MSTEPNVILFNKPYGVICQFTPEHGHRSLKDFIPLPGFYPAGRLDTDSEGLVLLTNDGKLQQRISHPKFKLPKTYWVQVEGQPDEQSLDAFRHGVQLSDFRTQPAQAYLMPEPQNLWERVPAIRYRKYIATTWVTVILKEGKYRQVRRMTAAIGFPTLRLIRYAIGEFTLRDIASGHWHLLDRRDGC